MLGAIEDWTSLSGPPGLSLENSVRMDSHWPLPVTYWTRGPVSGAIQPAKGQRWWEWGVSSDFYVPV